MSNRESCNRCSKILAKLLGVNYGKDGAGCLNHVTDVCGEKRATYVGMKRWSRETSLEIRVMSASGLKVGSAIRADDLFIRAMFMSGRNRLFLPSGVL